MKRLKLSNKIYKGNIDCFKSLLNLYDFNCKNEEVLLDLTNIKEVNPFNMLVLALAIRQCKKNWFKLKYITPYNEKTDGYMQYMGFYETFGAPIREIYKGDRRPGRYICIKKLLFESQGSIQNDYDLIDRETKKLAEMLQFDSELEEYIQYCFFEMIRNVYEHAGTNCVYVCAQYWPSHHLVELAIADEGCGIKKAMEKRFKDISEIELMKYAMTPGLSALSNHAYLDKNDCYGNSGYGLYMTKELALAYQGVFILSSGNYALHYTIESNKEKVLYYNTKFKGTAISIRFKTDTNINFNEIIKEKVAKAEEESKKFNGAINKASKSSGGKRIFNI